jgi:hypothetical protein
MTTDELNGILPAVKYRVPTKHVNTIGNTAVFVLPAQFAGYMKLAGVGPRSALRDAALNEVGKATDLQVIQDVATIYVELAPGCSVPDGHLQTSFKISRGKNSPAYYVLQSIFPEMRQRR